MTEKKAAIYIRVSTEGQAQEGLSMEAQADRCRAFCEAKNWKVFKVYSDGGFSAGTMERPALKRLLKDAQNKMFDVVLVYKIDRFSRKLRDLIFFLENFKNLEIDFSSVTEQIDTTTAMGEAFFQIIGAFAQLERGLTQERVKLAFEKKLKYGESLSRAPLGYIYKNKKLIPHPKNSETIKEIFKMWNQGRYYKDICIKFNIPPSTLYTIIKNPVYVGKIRYKGIIYEGEHKPLIDEDSFLKASKRIQNQTSS